MNTSSTSLNEKLITAKGKANLSGQSPYFQGRKQKQSFNTESHLLNEDQWMLQSLRIIPLIRL